MKLKLYINKIDDFIIDLAEDNALFFNFLAFIFGLIFLIPSINLIGLTLVSLNAYKWIVLVIILISTILSFLRIRLLRFFKRLRLIKVAEIYLYSSIIYYFFLLINYNISFKTNIVYNDYEVWGHKTSKNLFGKQIYKFGIAEMTYDKWSSGGWIHIDSITYYETGDYISVRIKKGLFGLLIIPKNQNNNNSR